MAISILRGPELLVELANTSILEMWERPLEEVWRQPLLTLEPDLQTQGFGELLHRVRETGVALVLDEHPAPVVRDGQAGTGYFRSVYHPLRAADGQVEGVIVVSSDVTAQVQARQQVHQLNEELAATNRELETVVRRAEDAQAATELERRRLHNFLLQAPAMICIFEGPHTRSRS